MAKSWAALMFGDAYTHRITAGVLLAYLGYLFVALRLGRWARPALLLLVLYSVQVAARDATVFTDLGQVVRIAHVAFGALVWTVAFGVAFVAGRQRPDAGDEVSRRGTAPVQ